MINFHKYQLNHLDAITTAIFSTVFGLSNTNTPMATMTAIGAILITVFAGLAAWFRENDLRNLQKDNHDQREQRTNGEGWLCRCPNDWELLGHIAA